MLSVLEIIGGILLIISCVAIIALVVMQESKGAGMGALTGSGGSDSFLGKNADRSVDATLAKLTKYVGIVLFVLTVLVNAFVIYIKK